MARKKNVKRKNNSKLPKKISKSLVSKDFLAKNITINENEIFPMVVMATMSSGKSTLINALLGQQILPSRNEACTAKIYYILDDDQLNETKIFITYENGETVIKEDNIAAELEKANKENTVRDILIRGNVNGVLNTDRSLLIVDTPGPNNSVDVSHQRIMFEALEKIKGGLVLYVLNATQFGINDDKYLLMIINDYIKENINTSVLFVINKVDQLDEERGETVEQLVVMANEYLKENGIADPQIIPVSALAASLFKKVINNEKLTRSEYRLFCNYYEMYKPRDFNMRSFAITSSLPKPQECVKLGGESYKVADLNRAIENTGIKLLEEEIQKAQILSGKILKNTIKISGGKQE